MAEVNIPQGPIDETPWTAIRPSPGEDADSVCRKLLRQALDGVELGAQDEALIDWAARALDVTTMATIVSWLHRVRAARGGHESAGTDTVPVGEVVDLLDAIGEALDVPDNAAPVARREREYLFVDRVRSVRSATEVISDRAKDGRLMDGVTLPTATSFLREEGTRHPVTYPTCDQAEGGGE